MGLSLGKSSIDSYPLRPAHICNSLLLFLNPLSPLLFFQDTLNQFLLIKLMEVLSPLEVFHLILLFKETYLLLLINVLFQRLFDFCDQLTFLLILIFEIISLFS